MMERKNQVGIEAVVGECTPTEAAAKKILPLISEVMEDFKEMHILTGSVSAAAFKVQVRDGKIELPQYMQHLFEGKEVAIGMLWLEPPRRVAEKPAEEGT